MGTDHLFSEELKREKKLKKWLKSEKGPVKCEILGRGSRSEGSQRRTNGPSYTYGRSERFLCAS